MMGNSVRDPIEYTAQQVIEALSNKRFPLNDEKRLQSCMVRALDDAGIWIQREAKLDEESIIDFLIEGHLGIEVKIKGSATAILKQCERYLEHNYVEGLILVTSRAQGFPKEINGKPCWVLNLGKAWL
jgi:hypothetical protein